LKNKQKTNIEIISLPLFKGLDRNKVRVQLIDRFEEVDNALTVLLNTNHGNVFGLDIEWKPNVK